jgi:hypothetical protein
MNKQRKTAGTHQFDSLNKYEYYITV